MALAILIGGMAAYQNAYAEPVSQVCNYDHPCLWSGSIATGNGYALYVSVYYGRDGKTLLATFKDRQNQEQVCYIYKNNAGWYFNFDGKKIYFPSDVNF